MAKTAGTVAEFQWPGEGRVKLLSSGLMETKCYLHGRVLTYGNSLFGTFQKKSVVNEPKLENVLLQTLWRLWPCNPDPLREREREVERGIEILEHTAS